MIGFTSLIPFFVTGMDPVSGGGGPKPPSGSVKPAAPATAPTETGNRAPQPAQPAGDRVTISDAASRRADQWEKIRDGQKTQKPSKSGGGDGCDDRDGSGGGVSRVAPILLVGIGLAGRLLLRRAAAASVGLACPPAGAAVLIGLTIYDIYQAFGRNEA